jgi:hypothetical protein
MIIECTVECAEFLTVLVIIMIGFALATYYRLVINQEIIGEDENVANQVFA